MGTLDFYMANRFSQAMVMVKYDETVQDFRENFDSWWVPNPFPDKLVLEVGGLHPFPCSCLSHVSKAS